ncbi:hypothetical protein ACFFLM_22735 [Deinococcus oregonensis]|uniref:Uncharacterized protein n=1 Tax=Deinococcus oregonensis TaxID=1805970 RepID=A0ABV6B752_9DEIO
MVPHTVKKSSESDEVSAGRDCGPDPSSPYLVGAGTTFTSSGAGHFHFNLPSSGAMNRVELTNGRIIGSDGTVILVKNRFWFVVDANGVTRVERNNYEKNALRCQRS